MPRRGRGGALTDQDRAAWAEYARHVALLAGRVLPDAPATVDPPQPAAPAAPVLVMRAIPVARAMPLVVGAQPGGLDASSWQRFRTGRLPVNRTLDLHGRTTQRAYHALEGFLLRAHADRLRCVEVITGRGSGEAGGAIRRELPMWLNLPGLRPLVLAATHPHAANPGSVRLLLRRPR